MARSFKLPGHPFCKGYRPDDGKKFVSRQMRALAQVVVIRLLKDPELEIDWVDHHQDKNRGHKGSATPNYGWDFWGDGWYSYWRIVGYAKRNPQRYQEPDTLEKYLAKLSRK